jgi:hypothetical protein
MTSAATAAPYEAPRPHVRLVEPPTVPVEESAPPARKALSMDRVVSGLQIILAARRHARIARGT